MKLALLLTVFVLGKICVCAQESTMNSNAEMEKFREFDFWAGEWDVNLRQIQSDNSWKDWKQSHAKIYKILDGRAILELWEEKGDLSPANTIIGYSLRYYDNEQDKWILWLNWPGVNRSGSSGLTGTFRHGRGEFFSERPISDSTSLISRYTFSDITGNSLRWDDAFSKDGGKTWAANWIMEFSRTGQQKELPDGDSLHTFRKGERCQGDPFKKLEDFVGEWSGTATFNSEEKEVLPIQIKNYNSLGNCSVMSFMEVGFADEKKFKEFGLLTYNTYAGKYEDGRLSNNYNEVYRAYYGSFSEGNTLQLEKRDQDGVVIESYQWTLDSSNDLTFEKWTHTADSRSKVLSAQLTRK